MADLYINCDNAELDNQSLLRLVVVDSDGEQHTVCDNQEEGWFDILRQLIRTDGDGNPAIAVTGTDVVMGGVFEIVADGNTGINQNGNWRFYIDGSYNLRIQKRKAGTWQNAQLYAF